MLLSNEIVDQVIGEIDAINFDRPSEWLDTLKCSAIEAVRENDASLINDDEALCELPETEYEKFKAAIKKEAYFHDDWAEVNLERRIARLSKEYVNAWNSIVEILLKYDISKVSKKWLMKPTDASELIGEFCNYDLPESAVVGGEWDLPDWYISFQTEPDAPYWKFSFPEFDGFIKSIKTTDNPELLEIEYYIYRRDIAHCSGYYGLWSSGRALVNTKTHRRWVVK